MTTAAHADTVSLQHSGFSTLLFLSKNQDTMVSPCCCCPSMSTKSSCTAEHGCASVFMTMVCHVCRMETSKGAPATAEKKPKLLDCSFVKIETPGETDRLDVTLVLQAVHLRCLPDFCQTVAALTAAVVSTEQVDSANGKKQFSGCAHVAAANSICIFDCTPNSATIPTSAVIHYVAVCWLSNMLLCKLALLVMFSVACLKVFLT